MDAASMIRSAREAAGLSKRELARRAGTSPAAVVAYESARRDPSTTTLARLLVAVGCRERVSILPTSQRVPDRDEAARRLSEVLDLAEHLPRRKAAPTLAYPPFGR